MYGGKETLRFNKVATFPQFMLNPRILLRSPKQHQRVSQVFVRGLMKPAAQDALRFNAWVESHSVQQTNSFIYPSKY